MALVGWSTTIKVSGAAVPLTNEATTALGGGVYQVTNTARRIWDPSAAITVKDGGSPVSSTLWSFDFLFGKVTFSGYSPSGAVTVAGSYLPVAAIAEVKQISAQFGGDLLDRTTFDSGGYKQKINGLRDVSGSLVMLSTPLDDIDPVTGGNQTLHAVFLAGTPKLIEMKFGTMYIRAWLIFSGLEESAAYDGLVESTANFESAPQRLGAAVALGT